MIAHAGNWDVALDIERKRAENAEARLNLAEQLLARAHGIFEIDGSSKKLVHEIAAFLGWEADSVGDTKEKP